MLNKGTFSLWIWMMYWKRCIEGWSIDSYRWIDWFTKLPPIKLWRKEKGVDVTTGGLQIHLIFFLSPLKAGKIMDWNPLRQRLTWVQFAPVVEVQSFLIYALYHDRYWSVLNCHVTLLCVYHKLTRILVHLDKGLYRRDYSPTPFFLFLVRYAYNSVGEVWRNWVLA